ncbi:MAG: flavodoxin-dependent (E)-4-hydroxy-3-methylbut-2-enyl-diphosphate synthase [Gammaproteobacteria bacterium WSBS_2016_MAG_OTU1]
MNTPNTLQQRRATTAVNIGGIVIGGGAPIAVQAMTDTDTADAASTAKQCIALANAGAEMIRITVNTPAAAKQIGEVRTRLNDNGINTPLIGDFHYNGHKLLAQYPQCAQVLDKYRINPGNVGRGEKHDAQFSAIIQIAKEYDKPVRIGVNWGSLDQELLIQLMDENASQPTPQDATAVLQKALIESALRSAQMAEAEGLAANKIVISCKTSRIPDLLAVYRNLATQCVYPLHLGLTEAGMGVRGITATSAALAILLSEGIGDTIRASLTPRPGGAREDEATLCCELLQSLQLRAFSPQVAACPGCGRTTSDYFRRLTEEVQTHIAARLPQWKQLYPGVENLNIAVMGCIVNGPGESRHADIGISLPGSGENPVAPVFIDGKKATALKGDSIAADFIALVEKYIAHRFGNNSI